MKQSTRHSAPHKCSYRKGMWIHLLTLISLSYDSALYLLSLIKICYQIFLFPCIIILVSIMKNLISSYLPILLSTVGELWRGCHHFPIIPGFEEATACVCPFQKLLAMALLWQVLYFKSPLNILTKKGSDHFNRLLPEREIVSEMHSQSSFLFRLTIFGCSLTPPLMTLGAKAEPPPFCPASANGACCISTAGAPHPNPK